MIEGYGGTQERVICRSSNPHIYYAAVDNEYSRSNTDLASPDI